MGGIDDRQVELFIGALPPRLQQRVGERAALQQRLDRCLAEARSRWPGVVVDDSRFLPFLAERVPVGHADTVEQALDALKTCDLFLCCACLAGDQQALARFAEEHLAVGLSAVASMESSSALADDIGQILNQRLLVGGEERPPKLAAYAGRGELASWVRVAAVRIALDHLRSDSRRGRQLDEDALLDIASPEQDQELSYLKRLYRQQFKAAFQAALAALESRDRNVLRLQLLDRLNIDQVGAIYDVHRATVARWNVKLRDRLLTETRKILLARLKIDRSEFESIMRLIQSQFDVSICRHLDD